MITQFLEINTKAPFESVSDALAYGLPLSLLGLLIVFAVLALLWAILALFKVFFYGASTGKKKSENQGKITEDGIGYNETGVDRDGVDRRRGGRK